jgi:hypothetical protein
METDQQIARDVIRSLGIATSIRHIEIEEVDSPWNEKVTIKRKRDSLDAKISLWGDPLYLYGRIFRLFLYIYDSLHPVFQYDPQKVPNGSIEQRERETYNHIWGIYIDSRMERRGIENFYDRILRRNLFIDAQKNLAWKESSRLFQRLWEKETYTHPEIIEYACHLNRLSGTERLVHLASFEVEINRSPVDHSVKNHIGQMTSNVLRDKANGILKFTADHCRGTLIDSSYYGIYFMYDQEIFAEMVTTKSDVLLLTLFDFESNVNETYTLEEHSEIETLQAKILEIYDRISSHIQLKAIKNPVPTL